MWADLELREHRALLGERCRQWRRPLQLHAQVHRWRGRRSLRSHLADGELQRQRDPGDCVRKRRLPLRELVGRFDSQPQDRHRGHGQRLGDRQLQPAVFTVSGSAAPTAGVPPTAPQPVAQGGVDRLHDHPQLRVSHRGCHRQRGLEGRAGELHPEECDRRSHHHGDLCEQRGDATADDLPLCVPLPQPQARQSPSDR